MALPLHAELKRRRVFRALVGYGIAAPPSIAVLPLADMSPGKDQEYFSDGVAEEISAGYERAMAAAEKAVELEPGQVWSHAGAFQIAETYAWFGDRDVALGWLERAYAQHDSGLPYLNSDALLRSLHGDPRFAALVKKMKLPGAERCVLDERK